MGRRKENSPALGDDSLATHAIFMNETLERVTHKRKRAMIRN
jgi:hypothetical protein